MAKNNERLIEYLKAVCELEDKIYEIKTVTAIAEGKTEPTKPRGFDMLSVTDHFIDFFSGDEDHSAAVYIVGYYVLCFVMTLFADSTLSLGLSHTGVATAALLLYIALSVLLFLGYIAAGLVNAHRAKKKYVTLQEYAAAARAELDVPLLKKRYESISTTLEMYYNLDVIDKNYRGLKNVAAMYDYFITKRVDRLEGKSGAYSFLDFEKRQGRINDTAIVCELTKKPSAEYTDEIDRFNKQFLDRLDSFRTLVKHPRG